MSHTAALVQARARALPASGPVPSPCLSVCRMDAATGWCEGCFRTLDEIAAWGSLTDRDRRLLWQELARRAASREQA